MKRPALAFAMALAALATPQRAHSQVTIPPGGTSRQVFNDVFLGQPAPPAFVVLSEGIVYRLEIEPATARISVRVARRTSLPPLFLVPLSDASSAAQGAAYLLVPRASDEYRLDVSTDGDGPVRVRISVDSTENARWARGRTEGFRTPTFGAAVHLGYLAVFRDAYSSPNDSLVGYHTTPRAAFGLEGCLRVVPNGRILPASVGGCAVTLGFWFRGAGRDFYTVGIAPEIVVARAGLRSLALSPQMALGHSFAGKPTAAYVVVGVGLRYAFPMVNRPKLAWEIEGTVLNVRSQPDALDPRRVSNVTFRLGAGLKLNP